ncbi:hypothetical protein DU505_07210 [Billgrantia montanilacus]|uniref:Uncharacterized protein n=2 Tax=Billgrantia montanilacus TaxID=2282305 RepID=A0A368TYU3_9GAMM|nr:hypothetical protein DU505_07210 [Halomonas montanilacus]
MFYAYSTGKPQSMDRQTLVSEIAEINFLQDYEPNNQEDLSDLLVLYNAFVRRLEEVGEEWAFSNQRVEGVSRPFGKSVQAIFERTQPMTAFGAEVKRLIKREKIDSLDDMYGLIEQVVVSDNPHDAFDSLIKILDEIAKNATKIGTSQRDYFRSCFRALFSEEFDAFCDVSQCWLQGQELYNTMYGDIE